MKKGIIIKLIASLFFTPASGQQNANSHDEAIMQIKGKWVKSANNIITGDPGFPRNQHPYAFARTDAIAAIIKDIYPQPLGIEAKHYASVGHWPLYKGGPAAYSFWSYYKSYYFNRHVNKILLAGETSTVIRIHINHFGLHFFTNDTMTLIIDGQPANIFTPLSPNAEWKGLPLYHFETWRPGNREKSITKLVLITRNGQLPVKPITQKQYLEGLRIFWQNEKQKIAERYASTEKEQQKLMEEIKANQYLDAASKEKILAGLKKDGDKYAQTREADSKKIIEQYDKKIQVIDQYLARHSDREMQQPVITTAFGDFPGYFGDDKNQRAVRPVRIDPSYFKPNLPRYVPQFIVMEWNAEPDAPGVYFRKQLEEAFPVEKLKAMIDAEGKEPQKEFIVKKTDPASDAEWKAIRIRAAKYADSIMRITSVPTPGILSGFIQKPKPDTAVRYTIPVRNEKWIAALPKKLTAAQLKTFIAEVDRKYTAFLQAAGRRLPDASNLTALDASYASSMLLLKGMSEQAAWLALKAVQKAPGNVLVLNNSGAVFNACGFQPVAVPVLENALEADPANSNIQNNMGQAYLGLGDIAKATQHLKQSVNGNPYHPHANLSLAYIYHSTGNKGSALQHVENSLRGAFSDGAMHLLFRLNPDARLIKYLKDRYKPPEYFNEDKYHLPRQCENVSDIAVLKGEYAAFRQMVEEVKKHFDQMAREENELAAASIQQRVQQYKSSGIMRTPFTELGTFMLYDRVYWRILDEKDRLSRAQHVYKKTIAELSAVHKAAKDKAGDCGEEIAVSNHYMQLMAIATREYQNYWMPFWREVFNDMVFWSSVAYPDKHYQRANYAKAVSGFLGEVLRMAETHFLEPGSIDCADTEAKNKSADAYKMPDQHCPVDIGLEFGIGSFSVDCEQIEYHFGGLLVADVVHSYKNHRTTIAIGAGLDLKFGGEKLKAGPIQGGFGAKGKMQYYLTFDGTHPADQGLIWETGVKYKQKLKTGIEGLEKLEEIETTNVGLSANTVLSVHNGWSFDGSLYEHLDKLLEPKPETARNKNVKIYKPQ